MEIDIVLYFTFLAIFLVITCLLGDHIVISKNREIRAASDNFVHGIIGFLSWMIVILNISDSTKICDTVKEAFACGLFAMAVDLDHFIESRFIWKHLTYYY